MSLLLQVVDARIYDMRSLELEQSSKYVECSSMFLFLRYSSNGFVDKDTGYKYLHKRRVSMLIHVIIHFIIANKRF
jgi:hypothetical protein